MATYDPPQPLWKRNIAGALDFLLCLTIFGPSFNLAFGVSRYPVVVTNSAGTVVTYPLFNLSGWPGLFCIGLTVLYFVVLGRGGGTVFQRLFRMRRRQHRMKRPWTVIGGLFLVLLVADGGMLTYAGKLDAESRAYAEANLPTVLSNPTPENFLSFMAPQDKTNFNAANAAKFFFYMSQTLGAFQSCDHLRGDSFSMALPNGESITAAQYSVRCHFDKASVTATVSLRKRGDAWSLIRLDFDPNTLGPALENLKSARAEAAPPAFNANIPSRARS